MAYDVKKHYEEYMGGAQDFAHANIAKRLMDKKRAAKAARMGGGMPEDGAKLEEADESALMAGGDEEAGETVADEMSESPAEQSMEAAAGTEGHKVQMELTPEEVAQIMALREGKQSA